jgi:hypothetical protein
MRQALRQFFVVSKVIPLLFALVSSTTSAPGMDNLESSIAAILPTAEEDRWLDIPWHTNLMQARLEAQQMNRPLFLWVMNGHPLGCT